MTMARRHILAFAFAITFATAAACGGADEERGRSSTGGEDVAGEQALSYDAATRDDDCTEWDASGECVGWEDDG